MQIGTQGRNAQHATKQRLRGALVAGLPSSQLFSLSAGYPPCGSGQRGQRLQGALPLKGRQHQQKQQQRQVRGEGQVGRTRVCTPAGADAVICLGCVGREDMAFPHTHPQQRRGRLQRRGKRTCSAILRQIALRAYCVDCFDFYLSIPSWRAAS